ncbi:MAG: DUF2076 domain-containing protein [Devosia sp.]
MLTHEDREAINGLFDRLAQAERKAPDRDAEAEALIRQNISRQPAAPYYLAQTVVVQQEALNQAEQKIASLEAQLGRGSRDNARQDQRQRGPWDRDPQPAYGGGFLAGAAQTALGVAGGVLLGSMIGSIFSSGAANAAEVPPDQNGESGDNDTGDSSDAGNTGGFGDGGGFDGGGFDMGGDF